MNGKMNFGMAFHISKPVSIQYIATIYALQEKSE